MGINHRIGAYRRWSRTTSEQRRAATQAAREASDARFDGYENPGAARKAHYLAMAAASHEGSR